MIHPAATDATRVRIALTGAPALDGLWLEAAGATCCFVMAHGAGAGMDHPFMDGMATALARHGVTTLRFQFPFMQLGSKRPDSAAVAQRAIRAAVAQARGSTALPVIAGGKSFGGRMTSLAQADVPIDGVQGIVFIGFPLHPAGKASIARADHLSSIEVPMLFLQGTRDALAELPLICTVTDTLGDRATRVLLEDADHSFHVRARSGSTDDGVRERMAAAAAAWFAGKVAR